MWTTTTAKTDYVDNYKVLDELASIKAKVKKAWNQWKE